MKTEAHIRLSTPAWLFLLFAVVVLSSNTIYRKTSRVSARQFVMDSDMEGYYQYLPYFFLKGKEKMKHMPWARVYGDDRTLSGFTCGVAIMQLPFFLAAHAVSKFLEFKSDGYNSVYFMSVLFAAMVYVYLGLYYLFKTLSRLFSSRTALTVVLSVFLATNLFYYTVMGPGMSHAYSFCLISLYIFHVKGFYDKPKISSALKMILPLALAVLIRPTTIIAAFYFILYDVESIKTLRQRFRFLLGHWHLLIVMLIAGIAVFSPQMSYWHLVTGKWVVYSYQSQGFDNILSPAIFTVLFGPRNGWFLYTPLMLVATAGLLYLAWIRKYSAPAILLILIAIVYINASWWVPTFSASAGYRTLVEFIPFMAIPLGFVGDWAYSKPKISKVFITLLVLFVVYNILFSFKYNGYQWWDSEWQWKYLLHLVKF
jgi:hypothetical protein